MRNPLRFASSPRPLLAFAAGIFLATTSCSEAAPLDPTPTVAALTTDVILPAYAAFDGDAAALEAAAKTFAATPDASSLAAVRAAWKKARVSYRALDTLSFGPAEKVGADGLPLASVIADPATSGDAIEAYLAGTDPVDAGALSRLGTNKVGFFALEYLLFVPTTDPATAGTAPNPPRADSDVLAKFTGDAGLRRRTLVATLAGQIATVAKGVDDAWKGGYADALRKPGNAEFPTAKTTVDRLLNHLVIGLESVVKEDLGRPLGRYTADKIQPTAVRTVRSDNAVAEITASVTAAQKVYFGAGGPGSGGGLSALVGARNKTVDARVDAARGTALAACAALPSPFVESLASAPAKGTAAYEAVNGEKVVLATDVASVLGVTIGLNPNDGD